MQKQKPEHFCCLHGLPLWLVLCQRAQGVYVAPKGAPDWGWVGMGAEMCCEEIPEASSSCESSAEMLLKSNAALKAQTPLPFLCQDGQSSSQARSTQHPRWDLNQLLEAICDFQEWGWAWSMACGAGDTYGNSTCPAAILFVLPAFFCWRARKDWCAVVEMQQRHLLLWFHPQYCSAAPQVSNILNRLLSVQRHLNRF